MKSRALTVNYNQYSTDNIWKLCGMELKDILIQQEFNFIGKGSNYSRTSLTRTRRDCQNLFELSEVQATEVL